jgi:hypothetical protein
MMRRSSQFGPKSFLELCQESLLSNQPYLLCQALVLGVAMAADVGADLESQAAKQVPALCSMLPWHRRLLNMTLVKIVQVLGTADSGLQVAQVISDSVS